MICLRCGYCCQNCCVVIVDDPTKGIEEDNLIVHEGHNTPCKHLNGDKLGEYSCAIHNEPWYNETPCYKYSQIEQDDKDECRMGRYLLDKENE